MQIPNGDQSTDDRMDISASLEITRDCIGQTYFEFMTETESNNNFFQIEDETNNDFIEL